MPYTQSKSVSRRYHKKKKLNENEKKIVLFMFVIAAFGILFSLILPFILR